MRSQHPARTSMDPRGGDEKASSVEQEDPPPRDAAESFMETFRTLFAVASCVGVHVVTRSRDGVYSVSPLKVVAACASLLGVTLQLAFILDFVFVMETSYDQQMVLAAFFFSVSFCFFTYLVWMKKSHTVMAFLTQVDGSGITVDKNPTLLYVILATFAYSGTYTTCVYIMLPLDQLSFFWFEELKYILAIPIFYTSFIPSLLDLYIMSFLSVVVAGLRAVEVRTKGVGLWTSTHTSVLAGSWLRLLKLLDTFNDIFSYLLHVRQLLFLVQAITLLFCMASVQLEQRCVLYFLLLLGSTLEVVLRFFLVCVAGDRLLTAQEGVLEAVRDVLCGRRTSAFHALTAHHTGLMPQATTKSLLDQKNDAGMRIDIGGLEHLGLHNLLCRMESKPLCVLTWGTSRLSGRTFVSCMGIVTTFLVVLLQLRPYLNQNQPTTTTWFGPFDDSNLFCCFRTMKFQRPT
nr:uncharacterized protein LOC123770200 [Procambarus clarkii]